MHLDWYPSEDGLRETATLPDGRKAVITHDECRGTTHGYVEVPEDGKCGGLDIHVDAGVSSGFIFELIRFFIEYALDFEDKECKDNVDFQKFLKDLHRR